MGSCRLALIAFAALLASGRSSAQEVQQASPPEDQPFSISGVCSPEFLRLIDPCVLKSRAAFVDARERFKSGLPEGHWLAVVMLLRDGSGSVELVFVHVHAIEGLTIIGSLNSDIIGIKGFKIGDPVVLSEREIFDWVIVSPDGKEEGNLVGKYLDLLQAGKVSAPCSGA